MTRAMCSIPGCDKEHHARSLCKPHYCAALKRGEIITGYPSAEDRFWASIDRTDDCWLWTRSLDDSGYAHLGIGNCQRVLAHRWAYEHFVGPIPDGLDIDHLCRVRRCVNPSHLEPVTRRENVLRGMGRSAHNIRKTHCMNGHPFDETNTKIRSDGSRQCITCLRDKARRRNQLVKEARRLTWAGMSE